MVLMYFVKHYCSDTFGSNLAPVYIWGVPVTPTFLKQHIVYIVVIEI